MEPKFIDKNIGRKNCADTSTKGSLSGRYDYVLKSLTGDSDYPTDACTPYIHYNMRAGNIIVERQIRAARFQGGNFYGNFNGTINVQSWKGFDIKHPTKQNHRLRHICLEGPEGGIYFRGRLKNSNVIEIPEYWTNLVDMESITVSLTQIGYSQDLLVEKIEWGRKIIIKSGTGSNIDCYYVVHGSRIDGEPLIVEYEGTTPEAYPGNEAQYSISGYNYDVRHGDIHL